MYSKSTFPFCEIDKIKVSSGLSTFSIAFEYLIVLFEKISLFPIKFFSSSNNSTEASNG